MFSWIMQIDVNESPDVHLGFHDWIRLYKEGHDLKHYGNCSTAPNGYSPHSGATWRDCYGWIATGVYRLKVINHPKYGKCILINEGGECSSRVPNKNHGGKRILTELLIHAGGTGQNKQWRGSGGCITLAKHSFKQMMEDLSVGEVGTLIITDNRRGMLNGN